MVNERLRFVITPSALRHLAAVYDSRTRTTAKGTQAWKYEDGHILRAPSTRLGSTDYYDHLGKGLPRRLQESNFLVTVNPNLRIPYHRESLATNQFHFAMQHVKQNLYSCINFGPRNPAYSQDKPGDVIKEVNFEYTIERGEERGLIHTHAIVKVLHYSQIQLYDTRKRVNRKGYTSIQQLFREGFNEGVLEISSLHLKHDPFVSVKLLPQGRSASIMSAYLIKQPIIAD